MRNEFLNELKSVAMESIGIEATVDAYAGSEVAEELITLDILDSHAVAMESYEEALFAEAFEAQEIALESAELSFADIAKFNGELGMEAVMNAVKRGAYGVQIQVKKIAQKIIKFVMAIVDYFTTADGKFKSYNKLFKKYKDKLSKLNPSSSTGDKEEKEYTIRNWSNLGEEFEQFKTAANYDGLKAVVEAASNLEPERIKTALLALPKGATLSSEDIDKALEDWKSTLKDELNEIKDAAKDRDTMEGSFQTLKSSLMSWAETAITKTSKDIKYKGELKKVKAKMAKLSNKNLKDDDNAETIRAINKCATVILTGIQKKATLRYKLLTSGYQGLLSDMAKLIAGGTRVND